MTEAKHRAPRRRKIPIIAAAATGLAIATVAAVQLWPHPATVPDTVAAGVTAESEQSQDQLAAAEQAAKEAGAGPLHIQLPQRAADGIGTATAKRSADEPLPPAVITPGAEPVDTTATLIDAFASDVELSARFAGADPAPVTATADPCLLDWALERLPDTAGTSSVGAEEVCGGPAAVIAGGFTTSGRDLLLRAEAGNEHAPLRDVLYGTSQLRYASVATPDSYAVLIVVARG